MHRPLQQKRAFITGGSRGIGAAIVKRLAREGAHVALTYVTRGGPGALVYDEAPQPHPQAGEVLVRVHAAALTPTELLWAPT